MNTEAWKILMEGVSADGVDCTTMGTEKGGGNAVELETAIFLYGLLRRENPKGFCIETGTHWGLSSAAMGLALKDAVALYDGKMATTLVTVDVGSYEGKPEALWGRIGLDNVRHVVGDARHPETWYPHLPPRSVSFAWYDADHSAKSIIQEFEATLPYLNQTRCILGWHDTVLDRRMRLGINRIVSRLRQMQANGEGWPIVSHLPFYNMRGADFLLLTNQVHGESPDFE